MTVMPPRSSRRWRGSPSVGPPCIGGVGPWAGQALAPAPAVSGPLLAPGFLRRPPQCLPPQRRALDPRGRAARSPAPHTLRADAPESGHCLHPRRLAPAKGRIERLWQTLQDRLVSELRRRGITTPEGANAFLPVLLPDHNRRFARLLLSPPRRRRQHRAPRAALGAAPTRARPAQLGRAGRRASGTPRWPPRRPAHWAPAHCRSRPSRTLSSAHATRRAAAAVAPLSASRPQRGAMGIAGETALLPRRDVARRCRHGPRPALPPPTSGVPGSRGTVANSPAPGVPGHFH